MFPRSVVQNFVSLIETGIDNQPNRSLISVVIEARGCVRNKIGQDLVNFCSFIIEDNPGLGSRPLAIIPFLININDYVK